MSALTQTGFDYAALPVDLSVSLKLHADRFVAVRNRAAYEMGKEIYEAQQELASHDKTQGQFGAWVESLGITRQTGYDLITLFQGVGSDVVKLFDNKKLSQTVSVMLLRSPDSVVQQALEKAESGEKVTVADVKDWKADFEAERLRREAAERALHQSSIESTEARQKVYALETQIDLLKSQPTPEPIIQTVEKIVEKPVIPPEFKSLDEAIAAKKAEVERLKADAKSWEIKRDTAMANNDHAHQALRHLQRESQELEVLLSQHKSAEREMIEHKRITDALIHTCAVEIASLRVLEYAPDRAQRARWMETQQILRDAATAIQMHLDELDREHPANALEGEWLEAA